MSWMVEETGFDREKLGFWGSKFLTGNGYLGVRGTAEELGKEALSAVTLAGLYDQNGEKWREPVNAPHPFRAKAVFEGCPADLRSTPPKAHAQRVDMACAAFHRETTFETPTGAVTVTSRRFASLSDIHLLAMEYRVTAACEGRAEVWAWLDTDIWDINGPHLQNPQVVREADRLLYTAETLELRTGLAVAYGIRPEGEMEIQAEGDTGWRMNRRLEAGESLCVRVYAVIYKETDGAGDIQKAASLGLQRAVSKGFDVLWEDHQNAWECLWDKADVQVEGDQQAQIALRHSLYLLLVSTPFHTDTVAIPGRGLSGQVYKGAMFWDTEIYMLPFFALSLPKTCENLVRYRIHTLDGARRKAAEYGYTGAFYPWESQENGDDGCTDYNLTDIFTGRPLRTYFRSKQIHISADVAYGLWLYHQATGDDGCLWDGGAEVILECARFYESYCYYKPAKGRYELLEVTGADEYHERVGNDAYTNAMARLNLEMVFWLEERLGKADPLRWQALLSKLNLRSSLDRLRELAEKLYVPAPDEKTRLIEQFDGYFRLEDIGPEELKTRILKENEYLGSPVGLATETQVIKQADVALLCALFPDHYSLADRLANWAYYEPRTEHGSSLSACIYALLAAQCGKPEWAYPYFMKTASLDLTGAYKSYVGDLYIGGTHPAANGGSWMVAVAGFAGVTIASDGLSISPCLPGHWQSVSLKACWHGQAVKIRVERAQIFLDTPSENREAIPVTVRGQKHAVAPGTRLVIPCSSQRSEA